MAVLENDLYNALNLQLLSAAETVNVADFTATGGPAFEGATTAFGNGRNEKFIVFSGAVGNYYSFDALNNMDLDQGIISMWIKPDFTQAEATFNVVYELNTNSYFFTNDPGSDDWRVQYANGASIYTAGETWAVDEVIHLVVMWEKDTGLDAGNSVTLYVNGSLAANYASSYVPTALSAAARIGIQLGNSNPYDGSIYDFVSYDYTALAASYTDAEIVDALYNNTYDRGTYKFSFELVPASEGLTVAGRKVRVITDTDGTPTTAIEIGDDQITDCKGNVNITGMMRQTNIWHAYGGFQDEAEALALSGWTHVTNAGNDLWTGLEADGLTLVDDVLTFANGGDYIGSLSLTYSGLNGKDFCLRIYNITQATQMGYIICASTTSVVNFVNLSMPLYLEVDAGDELRVEMMEPADATPTLQHAVFYLAYLHD